jgi:hypothetical protein
VWGNEYRNSFYLGQGADVVRAMSGRDLIYVDPENPRLRDDAGDTGWAGAGRDKVYSFVGIDTVRAGAGYEEEYTKREVDRFFYGGDGYDLLFGSRCSVNTCVSIEAI